MNFLTRLIAVTSVAMVSANAMAGELTTEEQKLGYIIGMDIGSSLRHEGTAIDLDALIDALRATYTGAEPQLTPEQAQAIREDFIAKRRAVAEAEANAISASNVAEGQKFLTANLAKAGVKATASGLQYKVIKMGTGPKPAATDTVEVHYRGTLLDGTEFDSSYSRNETTSFQLDRVIAGWTEGVQLMPVGSKFEFYIKPELAYGEGGGGPIPPNSTLVFVIELLSIGGAK